MPAKKKGAKSKAKPKAVETPKKYNVGDSVEAQGEDGKFYDATVTAVEDESYQVDFDGTEETLNVTEVKDRSGPEKKKPVAPTSPKVSAKKGKGRPPAKGKGKGKQSLTPVDSPLRQTRSQSSPSKLAPNHSPSPKSLQKSVKSKAKTVSPVKESPKMSLSRQFKLAENQSVPSSPKRGRGQAKPGLPARAKGKKPQKKWNIGEVVDALWDQDGRMYPAKIEKVNKLKNGFTYDLRFQEDGLILKSRKASQIQSTGESSEEEEEEEEVEEQPRSRPTSPSKRKRVEDEEYVEGEKNQIRREDYEVIESSSSEDSDFEKKSTKRKRPASPKKPAPTFSKKRKTELREGMTKMTKDQILNLVFETAEKKPVILIDLEKSYAGQKKIAKK